MKYKVVGGMRMTVSTLVWCFRWSQQREISVRDFMGFKRLFSNVKSYIRAMWDEQPY